MLAFHVGVIGETDLNPSLAWSGFLMPGGIPLTPLHQLLCDGSP